MKLKATRYLQENQKKRKPERNKKQANEIEDEILQEWEIKYYQDFFLRKSWKW